MLYRVAVTDAPPPLSATSLQGRHIVFLSWRDGRHPEGGGAELYLERVAEGLVARGATVTVLSARYPGAPDEEVVAGVRHVHRGSKLGVYPAGLRALRSGALGEPDIVIDVQNGMPFLARLATRAPVVVLVHHVHKEQWPVVYPGLTGRIGWWIESRLAPRVFRRSQYVTVSVASREELVELGVAESRVAVVHNGTAEPDHPGHGSADQPTIAVVGRLVPHKQVEHVVDAAAALRAEIPGLRVIVVGSGWWEDEVRAHVAARGVEDLVRFEGHVDEDRKQAVYDEAWVLALPSLKEGWGLVVGEAAMWGTPTVAYWAAGGTRESVVDGVSGLLVDDERELQEALRSVLLDDGLRERLGQGALAHSHRFTWSRTQESFSTVLAEVLDGRRVHGLDPTPRRARAGQSRRLRRRRR